MGITILLIGAAMVLAIVATARGSDQINHLGNLAAVWIILPILLTCFIGLAVVGASVFGMTRLLKNMPGWMLRLQLLLLRVSLTMRRASDAAAQPVMKVNTFSTRVGTLWNRLFGRR